MKTNIVLICAALLICSVHQVARSQSNGGKEEFKTFDVGGQLTLLRRSDVETAREAIFRNSPSFSGNASYTLSEFGFGGRLTLNFTNSIGVEAETNFFPVNKRANPNIGVPLSVVEPGGRKFQFVAGPKIGVRRSRVGFFAKVRPGFLRIDRYDVIQAIGSPNNFFVLTSVKQGAWFFNLDVGGVFEYYPTRKTILRVDVGDTIIHYSAQEPKAINPTITRNNLQTSVGFGFRF